MKLLLLDIGNTRSKLAWRHGKQVELICAVENNQLLSTLGALWHQQPLRLAVASVSPSGLTEQVQQQAAQAGCQVVPVETERKRAGVTNSYADISTMGVDRWLAMVGARQRCQGPVLVLDLGTALTADVLDRHGKHLGGWIVPGVELMLQSLEQKTSRVFRGDSLELTTGFGQSTGACLQQGCRAAVLGCMQLANHKACQQAGETVTVFLTGGGVAELPEQELADSFATVEHTPLLVLEGLAACAESVLFTQ